MSARSTIETPFGKPSDNLDAWGRLRGHGWPFWRATGAVTGSLRPELPFRANIYAMKMLGVERILSASAVGSLQEQYAPTDIVIPDQFFDRTTRTSLNLFWRWRGRAYHV
jgi:5'-methylthioadenosine phosphorylase